jgi:hypothetical protein
LCDGLAGGLNIPDYERVSTLLKKTLGIKDLKSNWSWQGMYPDLAVSGLNNLVKTRGALAHGQKPPKTLNIQACRTYNNLTNNLVSKTLATAEMQVAHLLS